MKSLSTRPIIVNVVTQHAEEAAFLWLLRDAAVGAPHYDLQDLRNLDERVAAHLDGLRIAGEPGWQICKEQLLAEEPGEVFAAADAEPCASRATRRSARGRRCWRATR